jgi:hypothetical protein
MKKQDNNHIKQVSISEINQVKNYFNQIIPHKYYNKRGFRPLLSLVDIATIIWIQSIFNICNLKSLYLLVCSHYNEVFTTPCYKNFVRTINIASKYLPLSFDNGKSKIKIIDSTPLEVCSIQREKRHKTMKLIATKTNNGTRLYYGLKLHIIIEPKGSIINARITTASTHDTIGHRMFLSHYPNSIYIGDKGYISKENSEIASRFSSLIYTPLRKNMKTTEIVNQKQKTYRSIRKKVETTFSLLKTRYNLVSTLPRSVNGYLTHYIRSIFMYQIREKL